MQALTRQELKTRLLQILDQFADLCHQHGLTYYLAYGSVLGAVRHGGMIPWDDDIDIVMPRQDYEKLKLLFQTPTADLALLHWGKTPGFANAFAKLSDRHTRLEPLYTRNYPELGVYIDIFPMDLFYLSRRDAKRTFRKLEFYYRMIHLSGMEKYWPSKQPLKNGVKWLVYRYARCMGTDYWQKRNVAVLEKARKRHTGETALSYCSELLIESSVYGEGTLFPFEGRDCPCPADIRRYLTAIYGDYTHLPPAGQQVSNHDFVAYARETF